MKYVHKNVIRYVKLYLKSLFIIFILGFIMPIILDYSLFYVYTKNINYRNSVFVGNFYNDTNILNTYLLLLKRYITYMCKIY